MLLLASSTTEGVQRHSGGAIVWSQLRSGSRPAANSSRHQLTRTRPHVSRMARALAQPTAPTISKTDRNSRHLEICSPALRHRNELPNPFRSTHNKSQRWRTTVAKLSTCKPATPDDNDGSQRAVLLTQTPPVTSPASALRRAASSRPRTTARARSPSPRSTRTAAPSRARTSSMLCPASSVPWARATML
jgi:hypothetical protein